ncbi:hypothetical protein BX600DRAFT_31457 [Xylariales sp. PMI_506]|nr:hypothetical protein BX600DRAFT_31457 [Xylariales sp. PMI_506]
MQPKNAIRARASRSCGNCRTIKRRCDQKFPYCGQCTRTREQCPGYRDDWDLVFRDQTNHTIKRSKERKAKREPAATEPKPWLPPICGDLGPSLDAIGVHYFLHNFVIGGQFPSRGFLNYIPTVLFVEGEHPTLVASIAAVGLVALASSIQQPELVSHARIKYAEAIRNVNTALASPTESIKDSTLMSVISLGVFEHVSNFESWVRHVQGAAALVVARGESQFTNPAAILMFNQVRADMVIACLHMGQPFPDNLCKLQDEAAKHPYASSTFWQIGVMAIRCVNLLWGVTRSQRENSSTTLLGEATALQHDFQKTLGDLALQEPYTTIHQSGGNPDLIYNGRVDLYQSSWAIRLWNNTRNIQIIICQILCYLLKQTLTTDLNPGARAHRDSSLQQTMQILSDLGDDMLATVPQALGYVSSASVFHPSSNLSFQPSVPGGYMMTWCLYLVGKSPATTKKTRKWIIRRLQDIGQSAGLALALQLNEDLLKIDQLVD